MEFIKLILLANDRYESQDTSNTEIDTLELFLSSAIGLSKEECQFFKDWALANKKAADSLFTYSIGTNATFLEEDDNGNIHIIDDTRSDEDDYIPKQIKISRQQFVQLLDDWQNKVCKLKPKEVIIKHENDQFWIETND